MSRTKTRQCPKCKSRFGLILAKNLYKGKSTVMCVNGNCDFEMNIVAWNKKYPEQKFKDTGITA